MSNATSQQSSADFSLYRAALDADRELTEALVAVYGAKFAAEKRYLPRHKHFASIVLNALDRKHEADAAWLAEMRGAFCPDHHYRAMGHCPHCGESLR